MLSIYEHLRSHTPSSPNEARREERRKRSFLASGPHAHGPKRRFYLYDPSRSLTSKGSSGYLPYPDDHLPQQRVRSGAMGISRSSHSSVEPRGCLRNAHHDVQRRKRSQSFQGRAPRRRRPSYHGQERTQRKGQERGAHHALSLRSRERSLSQSRVSKTKSSSGWTPHLFTELGRARHVDTK
jgi:hypothetical protein